MEFVRREQQEGVALVKLDRAVINAINPQVLQELNEVLQGIKDDPRVSGLVLTSANEKFFSIGFDLPEIYPLPPEEFAAFFRMFNLLCIDLYTFPKPMIAAVTGHATAGGYIIALCADYRFMAEGHKLVGMNESRLGVPITYLADCILRQLVGERHAREVVYTGQLYPPDEALKMGMVDEVFPPQEVVSAAVKKVRDLGGISLDAFRTDKRFRVRTVEVQVLSYLEEEEKLFLDQWYAPAVRRRLKEAMKKFAPPG